MKRFRQCLHNVLGLVIVMLLITAASAQSKAVAQSECRDFCLYIPAFEGPAALGQNVATILNLQIWQTFRRTTSASETDQDFGHAGIIWNPDGLESQSHFAAEEAIRSWDLLAQMVLWGKVYRYGNGVVVQPRLSLPLYDDGRGQMHDVWKADLGDGSIVLDLPRRRYELGAIPIPHELVEEMSSPAALTIYSEEFGGEPIGILGNSYVGVQFHTDRALVRAGDVEGWVRFPEVVQHRTEVVDFVGGLVRIYRGDWYGAATLMRRVIENPHTRTRLRVDAYMLLAMANARGGGDGRWAAEAAIELNPYDKSAVRYLLMTDVERLGRLAVHGDGVNDTERSRVVQSIRDTVGRHADVLSLDDHWLMQILALID